MQGLPPSMDLPADLKPWIDVNLPTEIKTSVFELLDKADLKQARLVSSSWYPLATRLLFDRVYISPKSLDIEVFMECVRHPVIKESIKEIIYDVTYFDASVSLREYLFKLKNEVFLTFWSKPIEKPSHPFHHFINQSQSEDCDKDELYHAFENEAFIIEGYRVWQEYAYQGQDYMEKGFLMELLRRGLRDFSRLSSLAVKDGLFGENLNETGLIDRSTLCCKYSGSPVLRSWNPLHARPSSDNTAENVDWHFRKLTSALTETDKRLESLRLLSHEYSSTIPLMTLQSATAGSTLLSESIRAYSNLRSFAFRVSASRTEDYKSREALGMLPRLLGEMHSLNHLDLSIFRPASESSEHWTYEQVFPQYPYTILPNLVSLNISGFSIKAVDFIDLLLVRLPRLRDLTFFLVELLEGSWEGVIEMLSQSGKLEALRLPGLYESTHKGGHGFAFGTIDSDYTADDFIHDVMDYILNRRGRHPCLPQGCEPSAAMGYFWTLIPDEHVGRWTKRHKDFGVTCPPDPGSIVPLTPRRRP
ncbi:hypothetical protein G7Y79_00036g071770 [Physcia stellaris]|nr:hypothetical protein G7Y79_00036g071770 [Physcia stellaris]